VPRIGLFTRSHARDSWSAYSGANPFRGFYFTSTVTFSDFATNLMSREPFGSTGIGGKTMHPNIQTTLTMHVLRGLLVLALSTVAAAALLIFAITGHAAQSFDDKSFQQAQAAGKTILIDVTAPWCPTCRQQRPIVEQIEGEKPNLVVYEVDFDTAKGTLRRFRVQYQSTLIVFKGSKEIGRSTGDTDPARIRALIAQGF
jgi:thioredoxin 1